MSRAQPAIWLALTALTLVLFWSGTQQSYPDAWVLSPTDAMNRAMRGFVDFAGPVFKAIGWLLEWPVRWAQALLQAVPWSVTTVFFITLAVIGSGWRLGIFAALALLYMALIGYWAESMNSLAIVLISVPMAVATGFGFGVLGFYSKRARRAIMPMLDVLQTIPAFAYLLPILILFGFGTTVGLVASVLYAFPPMVRNTILGLKAVPSEIIEAGIMSGGTPRQLFWKVRLPAARQQMLLGVNQTTMASLSMVSKPKVNPWAIGGGVVLATFVLSLIIPALRIWPEALVWNPAPAMNAALERLVVDGRLTIEAIKNTAFFFVMLPIKIGLTKAVSPFTWGFAMTPLLTGLYAAAAVGFAAWAAYRGRLTLAALVLLWATVSYIGLTAMPWPALFAILVVTAYVTAGRNLAIGTALGLGFLLMAGIWPEAVLSLYLCGIAVLISFTLGTALGVWASESLTVSRILRPIMDTLQTMPLFVILIPFVMIFKIGEFTALLAIIAYAIVPAIRYTEHGLRNLPEHVLEAAQTIGCTRMQLLWRVKLPLALPAIMLGLNQTIIYGIGMLVITALVGTSGLGQQIYIGLGDGDFGVGMTAGIGMAVLAMVADRMTQAISRRKQEQLGLKVQQL